MTWYVRRDNGESGPFTESAIIKRIADGNIHLGAMVREASSPEWSPIAESIFSEAFGESNPYSKPTPVASKRSLLRNSLAIGASLCFVAFLAAGRGSSPEEAGQLMGEVIGRVAGIGILWWVINALLRWIRPKSPAQPTVPTRSRGPVALATVILVLGASVLLAKPRAASPSDLSEFRTRFTDGCLRKLADAQWCEAACDCVFNKLRQQQGSDVQLAKWLSAIQRDPAIRRQVENVSSSCAQNLIVPKSSGQ
jgi:hypothetical protein